MFKQSDIVLFNKGICTIKKVENKIVTLSNGEVVIADMIEPVVISKELNSIIQWGCYTMRHPINSSKNSYKGIFEHPYLDCVIDNKTIKEIIEDNDFKYVHEMQDWLRVNSQDFYLYLVL